MMQLSGAAVLPDAAFDPTFARAGPARTIRCQLHPWRFVLRAPPVAAMAPADPRLRSDAELVADCRSGDARAWRELVGRYRRLVYGIPLSLGMQNADADEVFQQTFAELVRALSRLRDPERIEAWLVTTAYRASFRLRRVEHHRARLHEQAALEGRADGLPADAAIERLREVERLRRLVDSLGDPCRGLIQGLFAEPARSYRVLARDLGIAIGSIGATRARCLERLRRLMTRGRLGSALARSPSPGGRS